MILCCVGKDDNHLQYHIGMLIYSHNLPPKNILNSKILD